MITLRKGIGIVCAALLCLLCFAALADEENGFSYTVVDGEYARIDGYKGEEKDLAIPETLGGKTVRQVGGFYQNAVVERVTIPETVTEISYMAFYKAENLSEVVFPKNMKSDLTIGGYAFAGCTELETIDLPENTVAIGNYCFNSDGKLKVLDIPDSVTEIGEGIAYCPLIFGKDSPALAAFLENQSYGYRIREYSNLPEAGAGLSDLDEKAEAVVNAVVKSGMSAYEKALALHDYLIYQAMVTFDADKKGEAQGTAALIRKKGDTKSYAGAYQALMDAADIPCKTVYYRYKDSEGDIWQTWWNQIQLDGDWYHVDCAGDDPTFGGYETVVSGYESHLCFCVSDYGFKTLADHQPDKEAKAEPCGAYKYNFSYHSGGLASRMDEAKRLILKEARAGKTDFTVQPETFGYTVGSLGDKGILDRVSIQALLGEGITLNGKALAVTIRYPYEESAPAADDKNITLTVTAELKIDTLTLPADLTAVEADAFRGSPAERVVVGERVTEIRAGAFADMANLRTVVFKGMGTEIAEGAFNTDGLTFLCPAGSRAEAYAKDHGIAVVITP